MADKTAAFGAICRRVGDADDLQSLISMFILPQIFSLLFVLLELETSEIDFQNNVSFSFEKKQLSPEVDSATRLSDERAFLATLLADLCTDFILLHEIGHIASGHVEGNAYLTGENTFIQFSGFRKKGKLIRKAWEYEADVIGCMLIVQHLDSLAKKAKYLLVTVLLKAILGFA